jgi:hypothetical protein
VDTNGGSCSRSATPVAYSDAAACGSLDAANDRCQGGDTVVIRGGDYPQQDVTGDGVGRSSAARCTFTVPDGQVATFACDTTQAEDGTTVYDNCLFVNGSHLVFDGGSGLGLRSKSYTAKGFSYQGRIGSERGISDVSFERMDTGAFALDGSQMSVAHSDIGPSVDVLNNRFDDGDHDAFHDNLIHDFRALNGGHFECITWDVGTSVTIQRNLFKNCAVFDVFAKPLENISGLIDHNAFWEQTYNTDNVKITTGSGASRCDVTVSNNWFMTEAFYDGCPGVVDAGGNTYHSNSETPPDPRQ